MNWFDNFIFIFQGLVVWKKNLYEFSGGVSNQVVCEPQNDPDVLKGFYKILKMLTIPWSTLDFTDHKKVVK